MSNGCFLVTVALLTTTRHPCLLFHLEMVGVSFLAPSHVDRVVDTVNHIVPCMTVAALHQNLFLAVGVHLDVVVLLTLAVLQLLVLEVGN